MNLLRIAARLAASPMRCKVKMKIEGNSESKETGEVTIIREDGKKIVVTWTAEGGMGSGNEVQENTTEVDDDTAGAMADMCVAQGYGEEDNADVTWDDLLDAAKANS
jgi:hypothetical protein